MRCREVPRLGSPKCGNGRRVTMPFSSRLSRNGASRPAAGERRSSSKRHYSPKPWMRRVPPLPKWNSMTPPKRIGNGSHQISPQRAIRKKHITFRIHCCRPRRTRPRHLEDAGAGVTRFRRVGTCLPCRLRPVLRKRSPEEPCAPCANGCPSVRPRVERRSGILFSTDVCRWRLVLLDLARRDATIADAGCA